MLNFLFSLLHKFSFAIHKSKVQIKYSINLLINLLYKKKYLIYILLFVVFICASIKIYIKGSNNYLIFKYVYYHIIDHTNLYIRDVSLFDDCNHYGPFFSLVIAPFVIWPDSVGALLFCGVMTIIFAIAINSLPLNWKSKIAIYLITANDLFITTLGCETNTLIAALIIGAFVAINKEKDFWAACFIMFGFFIKLYSIVGIIFILFSKHKLHLIGSLLFWSVIFFLLPITITSPEFLFQSYFDWYESLIEKNIENANSLLQDLSVMGMMRRISGDRELSNIIVLIPAMFLFSLQLLKYRLFKDMNYRLLILASVLLFIVLFSSGSESPTYIIAFTGVGIWFTQQKYPYSKTVICLLLLAIIFSSFATSDLLPHFIRAFLKTYALKALPCFAIWIFIFLQIMNKEIFKSTIRLKYSEDTKK